MFVAARIVACVLALCSSETVAASEIRQALSAGETAIVSEVVDGDTVVLNSGRQVRLVGIQAPKLPLGRKGFKAWPFAAEAKKTLEVLAEDREVELRYGGRRTDRHRRALAHLFLQDGSWIQGRLLSLGMARVYTFADNRKLAAEMYSRELEARSRQTGIWSNSFYAIRSPRLAPADIGTFQIVEGPVFRTARIRDRVYLNYAEDWRTDFTVVVRAADLRMFSSVGMDPLDFAGRTIRVRGWIKKWNGPLIELTHPEQIEIVNKN